MDKTLRQFTKRERELNLTSDIQILCYECNGYVNQTDTECRHCKANLTKEGKQIYEAFNNGFDLGYK